MLLGNSGKRRSLERGAMYARQTILEKGRRKKGASEAFIVRAETEQTKHTQANEVSGGAIEDRSVGIVLGEIATRHHLAPSRRGPGRKPRQDASCKRVRAALPAVRNAALNAVRAPCRRRSDARLG